MNKELLKNLQNVINTSKRNNWLRKDDESNLIQKLVEIEDNLVKLITKSNISKKTMNSERRVYLTSLSFAITRFLFLNII